MPEAQAALSTGETDTGGVPVKEDAASQVRQSKVLNGVISTRSIRTPEKAKAPPRKLGLGRGERWENFALVVYHINNPVLFFQTRRNL